MKIFFKKLTEVLVGSLACNRKPKLNSLFGSAPIRVLARVRLATSYHGISVNGSTLDICCSVVSRMAHACQISSYWVYTDDSMGSVHFPGLRISHWGKHSS